MMLLDHDERENEAQADEASDPISGPLMMKGGGKASTAARMLEGIGIAYSIYFVLALITLVFVIWCAVKVGKTEGMGLHQATLFLYQVPILGSILAVIDLIKIKPWKP